MKHAPQSRIYRMHIMISAIIRIDFQPLIDDSTEFVVPWPCNGETKLLWCLGWWMSGDSKLNAARWCSNSDLPLMKLYVTVPNLARIWWFLASIFFRKACGWWINEESMLCSWRICRKIKKKSWENLLFLDLDLFEWGVNHEFC